MRAARLRVACPPPTLAAQASPPAASRRDEVASPPGAPHPPSPWAPPPTDRDLFLAAFGALSGPAFVVSERRGLLEANPAGTVWLAQRGPSAAAEVVEAARRDGDRRFTTVRVGASRAYGIALVVVHEQAVLGGCERVATAAKRWRLTRRQRDVLALLVEGEPTRAIAERLGTAPRTVESHLTTMFLKANVASRAQLVAAVWATDPGGPSVAAPASQAAAPPADAEGDRGPASESMRRRDSA